MSSYTLTQSHPSVPELGSTICSRATEFTAQASMTSGWRDAAGCHTLEYYYSATERKGMLTCHTMLSLENLPGGKGRCRYSPHSDMFTLSEATEPSAAQVSKAGVGGAFNHLMPSVNMRKLMVPSTINYCY